MEMEKKRSKGSFLSLFDWNSKSRKKLIWNDPEVSKQGKENVENLSKSQLTMMKVDEIGARPSNIQSCDFDSTLSICSDEGCGSKAPGLVARLMGLDSLPAAAVTELSCTSLYGSKSHGASHCNEGALHSVDDFFPADYINTPLMLEKSSLDAMESRARKVESLPIKRFQTEMLPPKSAKPIPVTHNKLLSPIKSPSIRPPKNAAQVMEAAAKIIEASPRPYLRNRTASTGPSSVHLRILNLKDRLEAADYASMPGKPANAYPANGKLSERSSNLYKCTPAFKGSRGSEKNSSCHLTSKGKSVSLTIQAKNNAHRRDTLISNGDRKCMKQNEKNEIKSNQLSRSQKPSTQKAMQQGPCTSRNNNVLGQNNQKQNSMATKGKSTSKIDSNKPTTRASSSETSGIRKTANKRAVTANVQPKRSSTMATDNQKQFPRSKPVGISQKKKYISRDVHEARGPDNAVNNFGSKSIKCNFTSDGSFDQDAFSMKDSKDVISFTFTSPLRRSMPESSSSTEQITGIGNRIDVKSLGHSDNHYPKKLSLFSPGQPMIDSDALSVLLDKKLQELTSRINLPQCTLVTEGSSTGLRSSVQDKVPSLSSITPKEQDKSFCSDLSSDKLDSMHNSHCCSSDDPVLTMNQQLQTSEVSEDPSCSSNSESGNDLVCWHSIAVAGFETPFVSESNLDSEDSAYGSTVYSSTQDEVSSFSQISESLSLESEVKWPEQSSSTLGGENMTIKQISGISNSVDFKRSRNSELAYVQDILGNAEFMAEEFVMGQTSTLITPNLFDLLENENNGTENYGEEYSKLERKAIFDCVSEFLELRCKQAFVGTCKAWPGWVMSVQRKSWMTEELYKEILGFRSTEEVMVDELVTKDMSSGCGKWLNFDVEAFEEGSEVEGDILAYLINELVSDLLLV